MVVCSGRKVGGTEICVSRVVCQCVCVHVCMRACMCVRACVVCALFCVCALVPCSAWWMWCVACHGCTLAFVHLQ